MSIAPGPLLGEMDASGNGHQGPVPLQAVIRRLGDVQPEAVEWLWPSRIPRGKLTALEGDPGLGKSTVLLDLAARLSVGGTTPDGHPLERAGTVILTAEDGLADTVRPRIDAAGGDPDRVAAIVAVHEGVNEVPLELPQHVEAIRAAIADVDARLVIVDPLVAYIGLRINTWKDHDVRRALRPLAELAEHTRVAVVFVRHLTKGAGPAIYRGGGSIGIVGAVRSALLVARDPEEEERRVLAVVKANLAPDPGSLAFYVEDDGHHRARIRWAGSSPHRANALVSLPEEPEARSALEEAVSLLRELLADGPRPVREVEKAAREAGVELRTLRRARSRLGVRSSPDGFGGPRVLSLPALSVDHSVASDGQYQNRAQTDKTVVNTDPDPELLDELREIKKGMPGLSRSDILDRYYFDRQPEVAAALDQLAEETVAGRAG